MNVRESYKSETLELLMDLNNRMYFAQNKIKNGEPMEPIREQDAWKLSDGIDALLKAQAESK